ncbi:hypothetical protein AJ80_02899 [Polytolypa hystricis UAMH7299]|uniref:DUF676 domain-containing protein n=1 Tax=Polytolypa hystricis (strain UAMH7299) TaxID=1447883 RepID=A0A2B7YFY0_POLH7|nr:hypothetical protein AJ80_02899 [Polytolypa hystricis UAMH7299]
MLITPRAYQLSQSPNRGSSPSSGSAALASYPSLTTGWSVEPAEYSRAAKMLLVHQVGTVRVGQVVRYTLTYTPSADRILPTPTELYVKIRNTSATPLRAAYLHGPYTLYASCSPSCFDPNRKHDETEDGGLPQFEPTLKAGGSWDAVIPVLPKLQQVTWVIEIVSQVIFSTTASVHFELLVGRDEKSLELGSSNTAGLPTPGHVGDHMKRGLTGSQKGVYSQAVTLVVDDTSSLWSTPRFPSWGAKEDLRVMQARKTILAQEAYSSHPEEESSEEGDSKETKKRKKVHFVVLTHGLHSNLGADMLFLKESIDAAAKKAREDARKHRKHKNARSTEDGNNEGTAGSISPDTVNGNSDPDDEVDEEEEEEVIVRGFPGNATRTERGIQYLGKRLAKYVLLMTYPDQPYLPVKDSRKPFRRGSQGPSPPAGHPSHKGSTIYRQEAERKDYPYKVTSISFIGHSLGGLVQTYAIAYIKKHSPDFFDHIKPINFVALASPLLGLNHENPMYVRFALEFGLVGRTGQDLGLAWSAPSKMRSGWEAVIGGLGTDAQKAQKQSAPGSKPLLRILPSGPAHQVLKKFRNRTVYSNVVNDGIVPLRTSCLLFLDWKGLDRVENARRENGLVGTVAEWGWAEITGANSNPTRSARVASPQPLSEIGEENGQDKVAPSRSTPALTLQAPDPVYKDQRAVETTELPHPGQFLVTTDIAQSPITSSPSVASPSPSSPFSGFLSMFKSTRPPNPRKSSKIYKRSQTIPSGPSPDPAQSVSSPALQETSPSRGSPPGDLSRYSDDLHAPPVTTFFESASDVLNPPLPPKEFLLDPTTRPRTIFHDRVYHPHDIPPPPPGKTRTFFGSSSLTSLSSRATTVESTDGASEPNNNVPAPRPASSGMKVEEKIARAYHRDLSWRKVLVRLEPDAHNNIIVRRMFSNAYGWPVVKHLVDTHFGYTITAQTADEFDHGKERAMPFNVAATDLGEEVIGQGDAPTHDHQEDSHVVVGAARGPEVGSSSQAKKGKEPAIDNNDGSSSIPTPDDDASDLARRQSYESKISVPGSAADDWSDHFFSDSRDSDSQLGGGDDEQQQQQQQIYGQALAVSGLGINHQSDEGIGTDVASAGPSGSSDSPKGPSDAEIADPLTTEVKKSGE